MNANARAAAVPAPALTGIGAATAKGAPPTQPQSPPQSQSQSQPPPLTLRLATGLFGILLAAIGAGIANRVPGLALADIQGAHGFAFDDASWLSTAYAAGELAAMPFAGWFAVTFSLRRFHLAMLAGAMAIALVLPAIGSLPLLIALRAVQGLCFGALIPLLMMAALRFLPLSLRLYGLALYAMTATFAPNLAYGLAALAVDRWADWRWAYWLVLPLGAVAAALVAWGVPRQPAVPGRMAQGNWLGMALGLPGLGLLTVALDQGVRLDWLNSPIIAASLLMGAVLTILSLISEWRHPTPFVRLQLLGRRNLGIGFSVFVMLLIAMAAGVSLPANVLARLHDFRLAQTASLGLMVAVPQLILGPLVALLLYQRWMDARHAFAAGLLLMAVSFGLSSAITHDWRVHELVASQALQAIGQPLAVVSLLFLATSVVQPQEGPFVAGIVNTLRALGSLCGGAVVNQLLATRGRFHSEMALDHAALQAPHGLPTPPARVLGAWVGQEAAVLSAADVYRLAAVLTLILIPVVLRLQRIPAPVTASTAPAP